MTRILRRSEHRTMPWRNGGGVTREAIREPADAEDFAWRLSFAQVTGSGPFSRFDGYDRVIALVEGDRMRLSDRDTGALLADVGRCEPFEFAGETPIDSVVTAPGLDINVMTRRGRCRAEVEIAHLVAGDIRARDAGAEVTVGAVVERGARAEVTVGAVVEAELDVPAHAGTLVDAGSGGTAPRDAGVVEAECLVVVLAGAVHATDVAGKIDATLSVLDVVRGVRHLTLTPAAATGGGADEPAEATIAVVRIHPA